MKISDFENEKAIDVLADLLDPLSVILTDDKIKEVYNAKASKLKFVQVLLKTHKKEVIQMLAILDDVPVEEYKVNLFTLPKKVLEILNDPAIQDLFTSQGQESTETSSGSAMENTEDGAQ